MKKEIGAKIILGAFLFIICFSWFWWILLEKNVDSENYENREMTARPEFTLDNYTKFADDYTAYFNDSIPFRNNLIALNNTIDYFLFKKSSVSHVLIGQENWLFYASKADGDPIACYQGTNLYTDEELRLLAQNCINQRDFLLSQGKEFVIFIAPNKERVYSEFMPPKYGNPADDYRTLQVYSYLKNNTDLRIVYPYEEIMETKKLIDKNIWYKTDTHWNSLGAYVGAQALLEELSINIPELCSDSISIEVGEKISGDLAQMLNMSKQLRFLDCEFIVEGYNTHNVEEVEWNYNENVIFHAKDADIRKLYVIRDSFSTQMFPYIGSQFNNSCFRHWNTYSYEDLLSQNPDIVVYETVERYIGKLMDFSIE